MSTFARDKASERISALHKEATRLKDAGKLAAAIKCLRKAESLSWKTRTSYPAKTWTRLPIFLQLAGRYEEALSELSRLYDEAPARAQREAGHASPSVKESFTESTRAEICRAGALAAKRERRTEDQRRYKDAAERHLQRHAELRDVIAGENQARWGELDRKSAERRARLEQRR